jgi:hypothetical protein
VAAVENGCAKREAAFDGHGRQDPRRHLDGESAEERARMQLRHDGPAEVILVSSDPSEEDEPHRQIEAGGQKKETKSKWDKVIEGVADWLDWLG